VVLGIRGAHAGIPVHTDAAETAQHSSVSNTPVCKVCDMTGTSQQGPADRTSLEIIPHLDAKTQKTRVPDLGKGPCGAMDCEVDLSQSR
jgi:hypothetical protein